jgi:hypothetical protein
MWYVYDPERGRNVALKLQQLTAQQQQEEEEEEEEKQEEVCTLLPFPYF